MLTNHISPFAIECRPGHVDFTIEVERSLRVLDGAIAVFDGVAGVEPQTETVWRQANKYKVPRMCFLNKMDRTGANFYRCVEMIKKQLDTKPMCLHLPIGEESDFVGVVDLVANTAVIWRNEELGAKYDVFPLAEAPISPELKEKAAIYRTELIELAVDQDEDTLMEYLDGKIPSVEKLKECIRKGTLAFAFTPVLTGTAFKNKGVQTLLDAIVVSIHHSLYLFRMGTIYVQYFSKVELFCICPFLDFFFHLP